MSAPRLPLLRLGMYAATAGAVVVSAATVLDQGITRTASGLYLLAYAGLLGLGAYVPRARIFVDARSEVDESNVALTFDGGPHPTQTPALASALERAGARGTFFFYGALVEAYPAVARAVLAQGHAVGTLGWAPAKRGALLRLARASMREAEANLRSLRDTLGAPVLLYRPASGAFTPRVARVCDEHDLDPIAWSSALTSDPDEPDDDLRARARTAVWPGAIVRLRGATTLDARDALSDGDARARWLAAKPPREHTLLETLLDAAAKQHLRAVGITATAAATIDRDEPEPPRDAPAPS